MFYFGVIHRRACSLYINRSALCYSLQAPVTSSDLPIYPYKNFSICVQEASQVLCLYHCCRLLSPICLRGRACVYYEMVSIQIECWSCALLHYIMLMQFTISSSPSMLKELQSEVHFERHRLLQRPETFKNSIARSIPANSIWVVRAQFCTHINLMLQYSIFVFSVSTTSFNSVLYGSVIVTLVHIAHRFLVSLPLTHS